MAFSKSGIIVYNLAEVIAAADTAARSWGDEVTREIRNAIDPIRDEARAKFEALGGTGPRTAQSVRTFVSTKSGAGVRMGGSRYPYALGREFGAKRKSTRPTFKRVGRAGALGAGTPTFVSRRIPYSSPTIFGLWTGNQFDIGDDGGRITLNQVSGRAFYPSVGAGAQNVYDALAKSTDRVMGLFPSTVARTETAQALSSPIARMTQFLRRGGIDI